MIRNTSLKILLGAIAVIAVLGLLRFKPWQRGQSSQSTETADARASLNVGYLPVTCHLTCPVTDFATRTSKETRFDSQRFTDFPTVVESIKAGRLDATFLLAPLAMKLREQNVPVKIVYLGHRDGSTVMVHKDSTAKSLRDLRGKTFAIPASTAIKIWSFTS